MITKNLKDHLISRSTKSDLNFLKLVEILEGSKYEFIGTTLIGPVGLATLGKAYFDMTSLVLKDDQYVFFVILHEFAHIKKIEKIGKDGMIKQLSTNDFYSFIDHILNEEILADRFGCLMFYHLNKKLYPRYRTQMLDVLQYQAKYVIDNGDLFGLIKDEETYDKLLNSFIVNEMDRY